MLYRHFPKIANTEISIISLALSEEKSPASIQEFLISAHEFGINLVFLGHEIEHIKLITGILDSCALRNTFYRLFEFRGNSAADLVSFLDSVNSGPNDLLLVHLGDPAALSSVETKGILKAAEKAIETNRIAHYGFSCRPEDAHITAAVDCHDGWDFYYTDYNLRSNDITPALSYAASHELGLIASNPFDGKLLENPPKEVHELYKNAPVPRSNREWALRAIWEKQEVVSISVKPSNREQLIENAIYAEAGRPNSLIEKELSVLDIARKTLDIIDQIQQS